VPTLTGKTRAQAEQAIRDAGLTVGEVRTVASSVQDKGHVVDQDPQPGVGRKQGDPVNLSIGGGPASVTVPDLAGSSYDEAARQLRQLKLSPQRVDRDRGEPAGQVVSTDPKAGSPATEGQIVKVFVSTGRVSIPEVTGKTEEEARRILNRAGFLDVVTVRAIPADDFDPGTAFRTDPAAGSKAPPDQKITLFVAREKPTPSPTPTTPSPTPTTPPPTPTLSSSSPPATPRP
jgi:serine/threonine-protein kinase